MQKSAPIARGETPPALASPTLVARVFEMKPGQAEKEGFALPQGAAFVSLAEIQPARAPELKDVREKVRADLVEEAALEQARTVAAGVKAKAETLGLEKAAAAFAARPQGDAGPHRPRAGRSATSAPAPPSRRRPSRSPRRRRATRCARPRAGPSCASSRRKPFDAAELAKQKGQIAASLRQQKQSELFRAFVVAARERYEIARDAKAYRRALGQEQ